MGFEKATIRFNQRETAHNNQFTEESGKQTLEDRIQKVVPKVKNVLESANMVTIAKDAIENQGLSSSQLRNLPDDKLEQICDPYDPAVIIALVQYFEVNAPELKQKG